MDTRLAIADNVVDGRLAPNTLAVRAGRRQVTASIVTATALATELGNSKGFFAHLKNLQPWTPRTLPMLKKLDGTVAQSPKDIAARWVSHFSLELGGVASLFAALSSIAPAGAAMLLSASLPPAAP